ncbi:MAG: cell wall hydrolase, partial [Lachnospiraceae bacterium]|nr:cell wall hydrolase [Lachnospiraceae bacterium]
MKGNHKKPLLQITVILTVLSFVLTMPFFSCYADEFDDQIESMKQDEAKTQETISNLEKQTQQTREAISLLQGQREASEANVSNLQNQSSSLQNQINDYSDQLDNLDGEIRETESTMSDVSAEIIRLNGELTEIQKQKDERYALLKNRMKTIYETGGTKRMLQLIFESKSFKQLLNRSEYLNGIIRYDQKKIEECQKLEDELKEKIAEVEAKEAELDEYQDKLDEKYDELEDLTGEVMGMLASTNNSLTSEAKKLENYDEQLAALDKTMKAIEAQTAAAQAELARQTAARLAMKREDTSGAYTASGSELEWLASTIQAEADGESYTGKLAVGSVIMNRVKSSSFPNSVVGVITQSMQFASYRSGKVELIMSKGANSTCVQAAQEVLDGARVGDYLFFMTRYYADYYGISEYTMIGNHAFFYRWIVKEKEPEPEATEENTE